MTDITIGHQTRTQKVAGVKFNVGLFRRAMSFAKPYKWQLSGYLLIVALNALIAIVPALAFRAIIDRAIPSEQVGDIGLLVAVAAGSYLTAAVLTTAAGILVARIGASMIADIRTALFGRLVRMPLGFYATAQAGAVQSRFMNDVLYAHDMLTSNIGTVIQNSMLIGVTLVAMAQLSLLTTVTALAAVPFFLYPAKRLALRQKDLHREQLDRVSEMMSRISERLNIQGALAMKLYGDVDHEEAEFRGRALAIREPNVRRVALGLYVNAMIGLLASLGMVSVFLVGGIEAARTGMTVGTLVALALLVQRIYGPISELTNTRTNVLMGLVSFERIFEVLDSPLRPARPELLARGESDPQPRSPLGLTVSHASFRYPHQRDISIPSLSESRFAEGGTDDVESRPWAVDDVSFEVPPGTVAALVGASGAGKTSLFNMIAGLEDPTMGVIEIGGRDIGEIPRAELSGLVGFVTQDAFLFNDTVESNLCYGIHDVNRERLDQACTQAQLDDVIAALPDGLQTVVGDRGYRFSGGERQRLAIARLLLRDPALVLLDEATAHLDSGTERRVRDALSAALVGRTAVIIAHRLGTILGADQVLVLDKGRIVERGTHRELLTRGNVYKDLYEAQFQSQAS